MKGNDFFPPNVSVKINLVQLINFCRVDLNMSEIAIMQLWHHAFAQSLSELGKPTPEPPRAS